MRTDRLPLDPLALALAAGAATALLWTLCVLAFALAPGPSASFTSQITHLDLTGLARPITWGSYFTGLLFWSIGEAVVAGATAALYNRLLGRKTEVASPRAA